MNSERPPILLIGNFLTETLGTRHVSEDLAEQLTRRGWRVTTASRHLGRLRRALDMLWTTWRERRHYRIAHIEVYGGLAFTWAEMVSWLLRLLRKPYLLTLHGGSLPEFGERWPGRVRGLLRHATLVTTPSPYLHHEMSRFAAPLCLIPNGLRLDRYHYRPRRRIAPRLVWLRAFDHIYNPTLAVEVAARLAADFPEVSLVMIGPDKGDGSMALTRETAARLGIAARVELTGRLAKSELPRYLDEGDIFLNTTSIDNFPVSVIEALASGLCVISTRVGGIPYMLQDRETALLVPPNDAAAMTGAVRELLRDEELAERLSTAGRRQAARWDWEPIIDHWEERLRQADSVRDQVSAHGRATTENQPHHQTRRRSR